MIEDEIQAEAAVAIIETSAIDSEILILKRSSHDADPWSGHLALPGGKVSKEDGELINTAMRETREECGIELLYNHLKSSLETSMAGNALGRPIAVKPFVFNLNHKPEIVLDPNEAIKFYWISTAYLKDLSNHKFGVVMEHRPKDEFPYVEIGEDLLWGFTLKVLKDYLKIVA